MQWATDHPTPLVPSGGVHANCASLSGAASASASSASCSNWRRKSSISGVSARCDGTAIRLRFYQCDRIENLASKPYRVARPVPAGVVVEIGKHVHPLARAIGEPRRPVIQALVGIAAAVLLRSEVEAHVDEGAHRELARR